ncbi:DUF2267 domain-containing protein [Leptolyngbya cf. ectocarpi LEGE 11479]|uniref:DUF2267 domain-containing protein n=1 Tax=Leptolyngbya cf. ectocarpi LEGE 11479 TaxID=1828722 RepID=A0A929F9E1_LEPEC|nr:DUF2267 domain-containing protein [Leptolyngbya ectocarpi]MBE9069800.1 DUF2267 domain-containing protein [Leptolyngbya cf. ectocarpi LEGE 11479]
MTIQIKEDVAYILLQKIKEKNTSEPESLQVAMTDFVGRNTDRTDIAAHIDYLNQKGYVDADFSGDAYGDKGPNPLPDTIELKAVQITNSGRQLLKRMENNPPASLRTGPSTQIATKDMAFLKKVMLRGNLDDVYDARDLTELVFRTMRDLMTTDAAHHVAADLEGKILPSTDKEALAEDISQLWKDTNPLVRFLSELRPPLNFSADTFLFRIEQEGSIPKTSGPKTVVKAVFSATKDELSKERCEEIARFMPGEILELWQNA